MHSLELPPRKSLFTLSRLAASIGAGGLTLTLAVVPLGAQTTDTTVPSPSLLRHKCQGSDAPIKALVDSVRHAVVITLGPCLVPRMGAMDMHDMSMHDMSKMTMAGHKHDTEDVRVHFRWPANVWVRAFNLQLFDKNHQRLQQPTVIHHMELLNFDRRQVLYPMVERLIGIGEETDGVKAPKSIGLPLDAGMDIGVSVKWNNQTDTDMEGVTLQLRMEYSPRNLVPAPTIVLPFKVDVNSHPGAGDAFDLPPGGGSRSTVFTMAISGRLIAAGGHLHDFGKEVRLEDVATGKVLARVRAHRTPNGEVTGVSHGLYGILRRGPHLIAGRQYRLVAVYEGSPNDSIHGAMGLMGGIFAPDHYAKWPKLDRTNQDYLLDLKEQERMVAESPPRLSSETQDKKASNP